MSNTDTDDNIMTPRTVVAPRSPAGWIGTLTGTTVPDGSRYVRGTAEISNGATGYPSIGTIESCTFAETAQTEDLPDGACGIEAHDFYERSFTMQLGARFLKTNRMPRLGEIIQVNMPEGAQPDPTPLRFVVSAATVRWSIRGIRMIDISGKMAANLVRSTLISAGLDGTGAPIDAATTNSVMPAGGFGDAIPTV